MRASGVDELKSIQLTPLGKPGQQTSDRGVSGRIKGATFIGTSGKTTVDGDALRSILGLKSTLLISMEITILLKARERHIIALLARMMPVYIKGHGWGHGLEYVSMGRCRNGKAVLTLEIQIITKLFCVTTIVALHWKMY